MMVTMRSSSSEVISPALNLESLAKFVRLPRPRLKGIRGGIPLVQIHIGFFANQIGVTASDTFDLGEGVHDFLLAINVGVEETKNELEVRLLSRDECCIKY